MDHPSTADFLTVLDAIVRSDAGPPGAAGILAFAVRDSEAVRWWRCSLAGRAEAAFVSTEPEDADVLIGVRPTRAGEPVSLQAVVGGDANLVVSGDTRLLDRFVKRYLRPASSLGVRLGGGSGGMG